MTQNLTHQVEDVHGSGIYPGTGPYPRGHAAVRTPAQLGHPEMRRMAQFSGQTLERAAFLAGRAMFGGYFLYNGINHLKNRQSLEQYAQSKGVPAPAVAVVASGVLAAAGGLSMVTGAWPKVGACMITTFLLGVSSQMHAFWKEQDPQQRMAEMVNFTKNMALIGASLLAAGHPEPWPWRPALRTQSMALTGPMRA